ncbi:hypothetical protein SLEP1_g57883 [Rubroshorea leprosula]|uniref:Uncharacterized protein n=1 Tax=Rubroshorea leprosula TaxID=152421 RepID=A0AAV5MNQ7_9ROSI|nr:hypothetical protein SLEP1_g57883 [Rubroshorea leprosula]
MAAGSASKEQARQYTNALTGDEKHTDGGGKENHDDLD